MTSNYVSDLSYADTLWKAADALRGQVDAAEYKHVVRVQLGRIEHV